MRAIVIDDMQLARESLKADLKEYCPQIEIVGEASGVVRAAKLLRTVEVDLIFLDIHMEDGEGFDLLDILPELKTKVIFTTASDEHSIKAFQYAAIDYLLKPISPDLLSQAVNKVKDLPAFGSQNNEILKDTDRNQLNHLFQEAAKLHNTKQTHLYFQLKEKVFDNWHQLKTKHKTNLLVHLLNFSQKKQSS